MSKAPSAWYALRRTLVPWRFDEGLGELTGFCAETGVDEVILKCDAEEFSHGYPSLEWLDDYLPRLRKARDALAAIGVVYSLNPWVTQGHQDRGRDMRKRFPGMRMMVGHDGARAAAQACPLCPVWREHTSELWRRYASTRPRVIWIEDDFRTFNHLPLRLGCFCDEHLRRFGSGLAAGARVTREELAGAVFAPGAPHPWRAAWLDLQRDVMIDTARFFERVVHAESPETSLGLMSSGPDSHVIEGRDWKALGRALAGGRPLYSRPPLENYSENSLRGLYYAAYSIRNTRHALDALDAAGVPVVEQTEVENWPFTLYSKSAVFTAMQLAVSFASGVQGATLNLYDHVGTPMAQNPAFGRMLKEWKPFLNGLASRAAGAAPFAGVRLLHRDRAAYAKRLPIRPGPYALRQDAAGFYEVCEKLGFPTTFDGDDAPVTAATGQIFRALEAEEIEKLLSGGLLLDGEAAATLVELGYGADIGVSAAILEERDAYPLAVEEWHNPEFGGAPDRLMTLTLPDLAGGLRFARLEPAPGARAVSRALDMDRNEFSSWITAFENARGGRVAVLPAVVETGRTLSLVNPTRKRQFSRLFDWLARGRLPVEATAPDGAFPLAMAREFPGYTLLSAFNLSLDPWTGLVFDVYAGGRTPDRVERLLPDGRWQADSPVLEQAGARLRVTVSETIRFGAPLALCLRWHA